MEDRKEAKTLIQADKFKHLKNHPMNSRMDKPKKNRLKRNSFIHQSRRFERAQPVLMEHEARPIPTHVSHPPWKTDQFPLNGDQHPWS